MRKFRLGLVLLFYVVLSGCATYSQGIQEGLLKMEQGDYAGSIKVMEKQYSPDGDDRLLQHMELGLLKYLDGRYQESINDLNQAEQIAEELYTKSATDLIAVAMSNPRNGPYRGTDFEKVFIHYYKALAYLNLALENPVDKVKDLESSRIEIRKVEILLDSIVTSKGDYKDREDEKDSNFGKVMNVFNFLSGGRQDLDDLIYRDDAYVRYVTGIIYELNGEYDDARISYQKAATLYEDGYAKQYSLGSEMMEQAWFDTIRMMKKVGGFKSEVAKLSKTKLTSASRDRLKAFEGDVGQVLVIQHVGRIPERQEMNLMATINQYSQELTIRLIGTGTPQQKNEQYNWFYAMYADRGLLDIVQNYQSGGILSVYEGTYTKKWPLGFAWGVVSAINLQEAMGGAGVRVTVPYYPAIKRDFGASEVVVDGTSETSLVSAQSLAALAVQEQIVNAGSDLREAVSREALKNIVANETAKQLEDSGALGAFGALAGLAGKIVTGATSAAETRNWLTLPSEVRFQRIPVKPGVHKLRIVTNKPNGGIYDDVTRTVKVEKDSMAVVFQRALPMGKPVVVADNTQAAGEATPVAAAQ